MVFRFRCGPDAWCCLRDKEYSVVLLSMKGTGVSGKIIMLYVFDIVSFHSFAIVLS